MKKILALMVCLCLLASFVSSCSDGADVSVADESSVPEQSEKNCEITMKLGGSTLKAEYMNTLPSGDGIAVYTHDYAKDGTYIFELDEDFTDYTAITVRYTVNGGKQDSSLFEVDDSVGSKKGKEIPFNGFIALVPPKLLDGLRVKTGQSTEISGYENYLAYERTDLGVIMPENKSLTRRITYSNPLVEIAEGEQIVFIEAVQETQIPSNAVAVIFEKVSSEAYRVAELRSDGSVKEGETAVMFYGNYNRQFANHYFAPDDRNFISGTDKVSPYSDISAIVLQDKTPEVLRIGDAKTNQSSINESGVYLFNASYPSLSTPAREVDFIDLVIVDGTVAYIGNKNERIMIPTTGGFAVAFVGDCTAKAEKLKVGSNVIAVLVDEVSLPEKYVKLGDEIITVDIVDSPRSDEGVVVLYTSAYGTSTRTNEYGTEVAISGGSVTTVVSGKGDTQIPAGGYVLSVHKDSPFAAKAASVAVGTTADISITDNTYGITKLNVTGYNTVRYTDYLVVYDKGSKTDTNSYGYEIQVDKNGRIVSEVFGGNASIPSGGMVLSGHGTSADALRAAYMYGADVFLDKDSNSLMIITNPLLACGAAEAYLKKTLEKFEDAKSSFYDIDYDSVASALETISGILTEAETAKTNCDFAEAVNKSASASDKLDELQYGMIASYAVENRAAWYRSSEKSDEDVKATLEKAKSLNLNALYIETWYNGKVIGYSDIEHVEHHSANAGYDALEGFCRLAANYGIEIHAWVENFFIGTKEGAASEPETLINFIPSERILLDRNGDDFYQSEYGKFMFLDPYTKENRELVLSVYREIITKYNISGIHLDYIRFPEYNNGTADYGYNDDIMNAFIEESGFKGDLKTITSENKYYTKWVQFRKDIITSFVKEVFDLVLETKPELWISCAAYPDVKNVPNTIFQDVSTWVSNGWIDEVFSMTYSTDNEYVYGNAKQFVTVCGEKCFYSTGLSAFGETKVDQFALQFSEARRAGASGSSIFSLASINSELWLKKSDSYAYAMVNGAYRNPSVQAYLLNITLSAELEDFFRKVKDIYGESYTSADALDAPLTELLQSAKAFDYKASSIKEKLEFANSALKVIKSAESSLADASGSSSCKKAVKADLEIMRKNLQRSINRYEARTAD